MVSLITHGSVMNRLPLRQTLISQTAQILQENISRGEWQGKLPAERTLCARYQVSRNTLRAALQRLQDERLIESVHGSGNYIVPAIGKKEVSSTTNDVALLSPEPLARLRPAQTLWIDELRALLSARGIQLHVFHGRQWFREQPGRALNRLISENPHACWILTMANAGTQCWFSEHGIRCVVAGSVHAGLDLPACDIDHRAMCRHAVGVLASLGHRKLALVISKSDLAGDLESEAGFQKGVQQYLSPDEGFCCRHDDTVEGVLHALQQLMARPSPPTGILVANAYHYLTVASGLVQLGLRVPGDVSVISRDDDRFLAYAVPQPTRYTIAPHAIAKSLLGMVLEEAQGGVAPRKEVRLMPELIRGKSIARAAVEPRRADAA
jgi:DNA-binding LacI/PurR family transcriptional regulator